MFKALSPENRKAFYDLTPLLIVIYCGAILGDYVSEALAIKRLTINALPGLFQLNALALFCSSFILFGFIDRFHRAGVIRALSVLFSCVVLVFGLLAGSEDWACVVLYTTSYISKISFFLVFWVVANDICDTRQSKAIFPMVAGAGLLGGLFSTVVSGKIVHLIHVENLLWLWAGLLIVPFFLVRRLAREYDLELQPAEPEAKKSLKHEFLDIIDERAVRVMASVYFLMFLLVFNLDYIFTKALSQRFQDVTGFNADGFVEFKFNVFLFVTTFIIIFQFIYTSNISRRFGVTNSLLVLPITFVIGFLALHALALQGRLAALSDAFAFVLVFFVLRQFLFEGLFSSNYQIFFSAFSKKFRGKGKLLLEGLVKPLGIACAGGVILLSGERPVYFAVLAAASGLLIWCIVLLKKEYSQILLREDFEIRKNDIMRMIKKEIAGKDQRKILGIISRALETRDFDLKRVLIKYLEYSGSPAAFELLRKHFFEETDRIREIIAHSLSTFDIVEAKGFLRMLLEDSNAAIRAGALTSIRKNPVIRPGNFNFTNLIFDPHPSVFEESARIAFPELSIEEKKVVTEKIRAYLDSERLDERVTAIRLIGALKLSDFLDRLTASLNSHSTEIWKATVETLRAFEDDRTADTLLAFLDSPVDRAKENAVIEALGSLPDRFYPLFESRLLSVTRKRTAFSLISILHLLSTRYLQRNKKPIRQNPEVRTRLFNMAMEEMRTIYTSVYRYYDLRLALFRNVKVVNLLKDALVERRRRFSRFVLDMLSIIDTSGALLNIERNFKMLSDREKANIIELIETFGDKSISRFLIPILEAYDERELLKIGSAKWKYRNGGTEEALRYFRESGNQWIHSIALFIEEKAVKNAA